MIYLWSIPWPQSEINVSIPKHNHVNLGKLWHFVSHLIRPEAWISLCCFQSFIPTSWGNVQIAASITRDFVIVIWGHKQKLTYRKNKGIQKEKGRKPCLNSNHESWSRCTPTFNLPVHQKKKKITAVCKYISIFSTKKLLGTKGTLPPILTLDP